MPNNKILVIDDDMDICHLLRRFLTKNGYEVTTAHSGASGLALLESNLNPDLIMTDFRLGDMDGIELIGKIKAKIPQVRILVITGYSDIRTAVNLMKMGANDYIAKPIIPQEILMTIQKILDTPLEETTHQAKTVESPSNVKSAERLSNTGSKSHSAPGGFIIGTSPSSSSLMRQIQLVAPTNYSVIIYGESGAGKEVIARMIHDHSGRKNMPFVAMDCGAIPRELANSELFGHEKGAFTGAIGAKEGHFEMANGGTLFLDEVSNLSYDVQVALLRVVQERKFRRIGSNKEMNLDVRIIVASNERLSEAARKGKFREDLYHRFNEFSIDAPPLRERKDDILRFSELFLEQTNADLNKKMVGLEEDVIEIFKSYPWPGNVRELKNVIKRAALLSDGNHIQVKALPFEIINYTKLDFGAPDMQEELVASVAIKKPQSISIEPTDSKYSSHLETLHPDAKPTNLKVTAQEAEYDAILKTLKDVRYNKSRAADKLGIDRKTLYNKLKKYGIE